MSKKNPIWALMLGLILLFTQCGQEDITVLLDQSGNLKITILEESNVGIPDLDVILESYGDVLDIQTTDENGAIDFGTLESGSYTVNFSTTIDGQFYEINQIIQVVAAKTIEKEILVSNYKSELVVNINNSYTSERLQMSGLQIAIIPFNDAYQQTLTTDDRIALAIVNDVTDETGSLSATIPVGTYYIYLLNGEELVSDTYAYVELGTTEYATLTTSPIEYVLGTDKTWGITSITTQGDTPVAVDLDYLTLAFNETTDYALLTRETEEDYISNGSYVSFSPNGNAGYTGSLYIEFNEPYYDYIYGDITLQESGVLTWECYDGISGQNLIITLQ